MCSNCKCMCTARAWEERQRSVKSIWQFLLALFLSQLLCSLFVPSNVGRSLDILPFLNIFKYIIPPSKEVQYLKSFTHLTQHTWRQVQAVFCLLSPPYCLENLTFLQKRSAHILSSLDQAKERDLAGPILWKPHTEEAGGQACCCVLYGSCS